MATPHILDIAQNLQYQGRAMDPKAEALKAWLAQQFPGSVVDYQFAAGLHKFRINSPDHPTSWLYISSEFVDDSEAQHIADTADDAGILDVFRQTAQSKWILLGHGLVKEVDENFSK